jgi:hypothetical protein
MNTQSFVSTLFNIKTLTTVHKLILQIKHRHKPFENVPNPIHLTNLKIKLQ